VSCLGRAARRIRAVEALIAHMSSSGATPAAPSTLSTAMWAVTKLNAAPHVFLQQCAAAVLRDVHAASDQDVATVSWAIGCAKGQHGLADILKQLEPAARRPLALPALSDPSLCRAGVSAPRKCPCPSSCCYCQTTSSPHCRRDLLQWSRGLPGQADSVAAPALSRRGCPQQRSTSRPAPAPQAAARQIASMMPRDVALLAWSVAHTAASCPELRILVQTAPFLEAVSGLERCKRVAVVRPRHRACRGVGAARDFRTAASPFNFSLALCP